jgi:hypothetical protein
VNTGLLSESTKIILKLKAGQFSDRSDCGPDQPWMLRGWCGHPLAFVAELPFELHRLVAVGILSDPLYFQRVKLFSD